MINTAHLLKVMVVWITIVWVVCFGGVALIPGVVPWFWRCASHEYERGRKRDDIYDVHLGPGHMERSRACRSVAFCIAAQQN